MAAKDSNADLAVKLETLAAQLRELDDRNLELEQLAAQRGVKLSCANIALSRAKIAFDLQRALREEAAAASVVSLAPTWTAIRPQRVAVRA
jgi:hypothetical protein